MDSHGVFGKEGVDFGLRKLRQLLALLIIARFGRGCARCCRLGAGLDR